MTEYRTAKVPEAHYRDRHMELLEDATAEVQCLFGYADIVTVDEVIEVKRLPKYKEAIGQAICYGSQFPDLSPRIHFILASEKEREFLELHLRKLCYEHKIDVSYEYQKERVDTTYDVGGELFGGVEELMIRLNDIRKANQLEPDERVPRVDGIIAIPPGNPGSRTGSLKILKDEADVNLVLAIVNQVRWAEKKFRDKAIKVAVASHGRVDTSSYFMVQAEYNRSWMSIGMKKYAEAAICNKNRTEVIQYS